MGEQEIRTESVYRSQGRAWRRAIEHLGTKTAPWGHGTLLFVGSGSSYYLGQIAAFRQREQGQAAHACPAGDFLIHPEAYLLEKPAVVVISRSGETSEAIAAMRLAGQHGLQTVALTCAERSDLAKLADHVLLSPEGEDGCIVMLRSFTSLLTLVLALNARPQERASWLGVCDLVDDFAKDARSFATTLLNNRAQRAVILGGGTRYGAAREIALKLGEVSLVPSEVLHPHEWRHGPKALTGEEQLVLLLADPAAHEAEQAIAAEAASQGAPVAVVSEAPFSAESEGLAQLLLPAGVSGDKSLPFLIVAGQAVALEWARRRGLNPDQPPHLTHSVIIPGV